MLPDRDTNTPADGGATPAPSGPRLPKFPPLTLALGLAAVSLAVFFVPLYLYSVQARNEVNRIKADFAPVQQTAAALGTPGPESRDVLASLSQAQDTLAALKAISSTMAAGYTDWPAVMAAIRNYDPAALALNALTQAGSSVTLKGRAVDDTIVVAYARALEESRLFSRVVVQSIRSIETPFGTPTLTPTLLIYTPTLTPAATLALTPTLGATAIPATATATPTPDPRDKFEPDDSSPRDVAFAVGQAHNFYPSGDVDKIKFLAKAGRYYHVFTSNMTPGVDTLLSVHVGSVVYVNDDRQPSDLSSDVLFQGQGTDQVAVVDVTNRGQYSPDMWYTLTVEEIVPTATPTAGVSPTLTLTPSATWTPDVRDAYEPDSAPQPIALAQAQLHNFFPSGDIDKVMFLVKPGYSYRVSTTALASGVDTVLTVAAGDGLYVNDNRPTHAANDLSSEIVFTFGGRSAVWATVTVMNLGQFGADKTYTLLVEEVVATAMPSLTPTPDLRDNYEPDDAQPPDIFFGQPQLHNFYPAGDTDRAKFLAKAGRFYHIYTSALAAGVDTLITVTIESVVYSNDDRQSGDLSSEVFARAPLDHDAQAVILVTNRGASGADKLYTLNLEELSDPYEPDDVTPKPIAIGETQTHSFYPAADVDQVQFLAKAGRTYRVTTSGLSQGVDTKMTVSLRRGGVELVSYTNDDRAPGDPSSEVVFRVGTGTDVDAVAKIENRGQFGVDKHYLLSVSEVLSGAGPRREDVARPPLWAASWQRSAATPAAAAVKPPAPRVVAVGPSVRAPALDTKAVEFVIVLEVRPK